MPKDKRHKGGARFYACDVCGKRATWNIQQQYLEYSIDENEDFTETDCWDGGENDFLCDECHQNDARN